MATEADKPVRDLPALAHLPVVSGGAAPQSGDGGAIGRLLRGLFGG